jgi:hypothetical protein
MYDMTTRQQYEEWKNDPQAQQEYQDWRTQDELKRAQLPDPFTNDPNFFTKSFFLIFGEHHE